MQFLYYENPTTNLILTGDEHRYLFKVRRVKKNETINIRNLKDDYIYQYKIEEINKKEATLKLINKILTPNRPKKYLHIGWCIIDPKQIEKQISSLNEIGVSKISFIYCDFSQKNFKINIERLKKILINSSQQCGRSDILEIEILESLDTFKEKYNEFIALDFGGELNFNDIKSPVVIGCEGGFSQRERELFNKVISLDGFILRSETAVCSISAKILL